MLTRLSEFFSPKLKPPFYVVENKTDEYKYFLQYVKLSCRNTGLSNSAFKFKFLNKGRTCNFQLFRGSSKN